MDHQSIISELEVKLGEIEFRMSELQAQKAETEVVLNYMKKDAATHFTGNIRPPRPGVDLSKVSDRTLSALIIHVLEEQFSKQFSIPDMILATGVQDERVVRSTLARLYREQRIEKVARGIYQAKRRTLQVVENRTA